MPRRHRSARDRSGIDLHRPTQLGAPAWALTPGYDVRMTVAEKEYRCPGCDHVVRQGIGHIVAVPLGAPEERRHWHTECWRTELRRTRGR